MKLRSSTKIFIGFVVICAGTFFGYRFYTTRAIAGSHFDPVVPKDVNLVGINPGAGYQIIVANEIAQLVESEGGFHSNENGGESGSTSGSIKKRIPIKEMLGVLRGDKKDLGKFVMIMNDMKEDDNWPAERVKNLWTAENLRKALDGDATLIKKLETDLNMKVDGSPLATLRPSSLANGIIIDYPVSLTVEINGKDQEVVGRVEEPFKPRLIRAVEEKIADKQATPTMMAGYYSEEAKKEIADPKKREDIRKAIESTISPQNAKMLREAPERVLQSAEVVINQDQIKGASYNSYGSGDQANNDLKIQLTDEGQRRLWKYSMDKVGSHLLLISGGVAIAAPRIQHELTEDELTIRRMKDQVLVKQAVDDLNNTKSAAHS